MSSLWIDSSKKIKRFSPLLKDTKADICVIGAGIFGLTCAYYLSKLGYSVVVIEKDEIGQKTTGHTSAKITSQHDLFYNYLNESFGEKFAYDYLNINEKAIENIKEIIDTEKINCDFEYQNSYVYTTKKDEILDIQNEVYTLEKLGFNCDFVTKVGLPFSIEGAICFKNQAQFNPFSYIMGLCNCIVSSNGNIFTNTTAVDVQKSSDSYIVKTNHANIEATHVIVATHYPFINFPGFYFAKMYQATSYMLAVDTNKSLFNGMYINVKDPIFSYRTAKYNGKELLLVGGAGHKTGQASSYADTYGVLEQEVKKYYPDSKVLYRWNTRDCVSLDKLPYIGPYSSTMPNVYVGTGFKKWGMTLSNVAANLIVDLIQEKENPYYYLFDSSRLKPFKNRDEMKNILVQSTNSLFLDKFKASNLQFEDIPLDSGGIIEINHDKVGIYKDVEGNLIAVKPICTHLGCLLSWNDVDKTWDCPCHGSRFDFTGKNLYEPAFKDLERYFIDN